MPSLGTKDSITLFLLRPQDGDEADLIASIGADVTLNAGGLLEGEYVKADTVASAHLGSGRKCIDLRTVVVTTNPGLMAQAVELELIKAAAATFLRQSTNSADDVHAESIAKFEQEGGSASATVLASDTMAMIDRIANLTLRRDNFAGDYVALVQSVIDTPVSSAAIDAVTPELQRGRAAQMKRRREQDAHSRAGRPDRAVAVGRATEEYTTARVAALVTIHQRAVDDSDAQQVRVNEVVAELQAARDAGGAAAGWASLKGSIMSFLFTDDTEAGDNTPVDEIMSRLRALLRARMVAAAANHLRIALAAGGGSAAQADANQRVMGLVTSLAGRATDAALHLDQQAQARMRRASGVFLPARSDLRAELTRQVIANAGDNLIATLIREPLVATERGDEASRYDRFEDAVLAAARRLTGSLRNDSLGQTVSRLPEPLRDSIAKELVSANPSLDFRAGHAAPLVFRRAAVPGGPTGALGVAILRRFTGVEVMHSNDPLLAYGVAATDVFAIDQLASYHGRWGAAREDARAAGIGDRLVSDRRLLEIEDGLTLDRDLDGYMVRGIACGCIAPSKEGTTLERAGGTFYIMPPGQQQRPSQIDPTRLDAVFTGYRLGRSLPEMRTTLRHAPQHRAAIDAAWRTWRDERPHDQRLTGVDAVTMNHLPSDELVPVCRDLRNALVREQMRTAA